MRATIIQLAGLLTAVGSGFAHSLPVGGVATGACLVYVGLAMEKR